MSEKSSRIFFMLRRQPRLRRVKVVLSSARPSFLEVSLHDSNLKTSGSGGLSRGAVGALGIGSMEGSSSILKIKICIQKLNVFGEILSP